jgi:hypothetical protein
MRLNEGSVNRTEIRIRPKTATDKSGSGCIEQFGLLFYTSFELISFFPFVVLWSPS